MTGEKPPPRHTPCGDVRSWLRKIYGLTETAIRDVLTLLDFPPSFRVAGETEYLATFNGWSDVDWETGRACWKADGKDHPLEVQWREVADAVARLRRQERERLTLRSLADTSVAETQSATASEANRATCHRMPSVTPSSIEISPPAQLIDLAQATSAPVPTPKAPEFAPRARRGRGGAPTDPEYDWDAFTQEAMRYADGLDGIGSRGELTAHLLKWCSSAWTKQPDIRTIQRKVSRICPPEIPPD